MSDYWVNPMDAKCKEDNKDAYLAELGYTNVSPKSSGQFGINWKSSTYRNYRRTDKWTSHLIKALFHKGSNGRWMARSLKYDEIV